MIAIDPEFRDLIPPLTADERSGLEAALVASGGARDALVVWNGVLLDGHNRHEICTRLGLSFTTTAPKEEIADRDAALIWIIRNQLGRRNLGDMVRIELELRLEPLLKEKARQRRLAGVPHICEEGLDRNELTVTGQVADAVGVSRRKVEEVKALQRAPAPLLQAARANAITIHAAYEGMKALDKLPEERRAAIVERIAADPTLDVAKTINDVRKAVFSSESVEWYTPAKYVAAARKVLGGIDLDPASNVTANEIVQAAKIFTQADDGLGREWHGRVWMNPPYGDDGKTNTGTWCEKLISEFMAERVSSAILLVNAVTDRKWFQQLWDCAALCFTDHRIEFYTPSGTPQSPVSGNVFVYLGEDVDAFKEAFAPFGAVVVRV